MTPFEVGGIAVDERSLAAVLGVTGAAWGLTATRSGARRCSKYSAVMIPTIEADDASWPPTLTPDDVARTRLAWWTMLVASHSTRRCTASSASRDGAARTAAEPSAREIGIPMELNAKSPIEHCPLS